MVISTYRDAATQPRSEMVSQKTKLREPSMLVQRGPLPAVHNLIVIK